MIITHPRSASRFLRAKPHYSKSQIFVQNSTLQFFSGNQSCQQLKSANPQYFHEFFTQIFFDNFSREIKVVNS